MSVFEAVLLLLLLGWIGKFLFGKGWVRAWATGVSPLEMRGELTAIQKEQQIRELLSQELEASQPIMDIHVALRDDGTGARCRLFIVMEPLSGLKLGFPVEPVKAWLPDFDYQIVGDPRNAGLVERAVHEIDRRLGIQGFNDSHWRKTYDTPLPNLPGFPWDGSPLPPHDHQTVAAYLTYEMTQGRGRS